MDLQYQHPEFFVALFAVPLVCLLFWYVLRWKSSAVKKIGDIKLVKELIKGYSSVRYLIKFIFITLVLTCLIMAMVNPERPGKMDKVERKGVDVMIALDVSNSMLAQDISPSRLEKAKQFVNKLIDELQNDRIGLVLFAGRAYIQMPLTTDHAAAKMYVQNADPSMVPTQGTMISEALTLCSSAFNSKERKFKSIVLVTDGEDHDPNSIQVAEHLAANGVMINTVGIGSATGTPIPDPATGQYHKDESGNTVFSKLNEEQLRELAASTNGVYVNPDNVNEAVVIVTNKLSTIQKTAMEDAAFKDNINYFQWFAGAALVFLILEFLLPERKMKII